MERLDQYVVRQLSSLSRSSAAKLVEDGKVSVNGDVQLKSAYKVKPDDKISIDYDEASSAKVPDIDMPVIYEDDDCVAIDKPAGILAHSKGAFNPEATVATWLSGRVKGMEGERAGIVHRLDRGTSGVMICAKTPEALAWLQKQFSQRKARKEYIAIVSGEPAEPEAVIDMPIERNPKRPQTFRAGAGGKSAVTAYKVLKTVDGLSLVELKPKTGRTHQLRVHMAKIGHPIVGDELYGGPAAGRMFLHAKSLGVTLPSRERKTLEAPVPVEFDKELKA